MGISIKNSLHTQARTMERSNIRKISDAGNALERAMNKIGHFRSYSFSNVLTQNSIFPYALMEKKIFDCFTESVIKYISREKYGEKSIMISESECPYDNYNDIVEGNEYYLTVFNTPHEVYVHVWKK